MKGFLVTVMFMILATPCYGREQSEFETRVQKGISRALPSVVIITTESSKGSTFGAGFVLDNSKNLVITNYHVVSGTERVFIKTRDEKEAIACKVVFYDAKRDLALLKAKLDHKLPNALQLASSSTVEIGQFVIAAGSPGGYDFSVSLGIVSATNRILPDQNTKLAFIQVDAPMYHGSSGGPLVNLDGEVIGVSSRGGAQGAAAFAVPSNDVLSFLEDYSKRKKPKSGHKKFGYLGAVLQPLSPAFRKYYEYFGANGVLVSGVYPNSAAAKGGVRSGDILLALDDLSLVAAEEAELELAKNYIAGSGPGTHVLVVYRRGKEERLNVKLQGKPPCSAQPIEGKSQSVLLHKKTSCFWFPQGEFVEVTRSWAKGQDRLSMMRKGDLLISISHGSIDLGHYVEELLTLPSSTAATVIRHGKPRLVLLGGN